MAQGKILPSQIGLKNIKFDTALNLTRLRFEINQTGKLSQNKEVANLLQHGYDVVGVEVIGYFLRSIMHRKEPFHNSLHKFSLYLSSALEVTHIHEEYLFSNCSIEKRQWLNDLIQKSMAQYKDPPICLISFFDMTLELQSILLNSDLPKGIINQLISINSGKIVLLRGYQYHGLKIGDNKFLITNDQLNMIHNKVFEIFNTLLLSWLLTNTTFSSSFFSRVDKLLKLMINLVITKGNQAYTIFKNFDGIGSAIILSQDVNFNNFDPINNVTTELINDDIIPLCTIERIIKLFGIIPHEIIELTTLSKLCGHPDIDTIKGLNKLRKRTLAANPVSREEVLRLICSMKKNLIKQYYFKHKKWPLVEFDKNCNPTLIHCCLNNIWLTSLKVPSTLPKVQLLDFSNIELSPLMDFDYIDSQFDLLKDTALATLRSTLHDGFIYKSKKKSHQRTLLHFLLSSHPHKDIRDYFNKLNEKNPDALNYLVIKLTQKERELKEEGRFFGQSPYVERSRRCILEHNIAKLMEKYNCHQAMTLSELQKFERLYLLSRLGVVNDKIIPLYISVDVEAFNNNFRRTVCEPVGNEFFNKIFNVPYYSDIMNTFEHSFLYISDGVWDYGWEGQYGGIEGLFQKYWTWMYEAVASQVAESTGYKFFIMVNGDDLRVILLIPKNEIKNVELDKFLKSIASTFEINYHKFGFKLKLQETYFSTNYIGFGKVYLLDGAFLGNTLKKGAKMHGLANLMGDYPLEYLKGVMSETLSTMSYSMNHRYIYTAGMFIFQIYLQMYLPHYDDTQMFDKVVLLLYPSSFGGLPVLPYLRCLYKGESDLETIWISLYFFIYKNNKTMGSKLFHLLLSSIHQTTDFSVLATNPYGLPTLSPTPGISLIRNFIRVKLPLITKNRDFRKILVKVSLSKRSRFIKALFSCVPMPAKSLSVIYSVSAAGQIDEFIEKFDTSKSLGGFMTKGFKSINGLRIVQQAKKADLKCIQWSYSKVIERTRLISHLPGLKKYSEYIDCPTNYSDTIRSWCYKRNLVGITYPSPVDQIKIFDQSDNFDVSSLDYLTFIRESTLNKKSIIHSHGTNKTYLGNHTHLKLLAPSIEIKNTSPGIKRVTKILKIYTMMEKLGPDCVNFLKKSLLDLTGIDPELLISICCQHTSGSITHRIPSNHWSPLVGMNELPNRSSFVKTVTSTDQVSRLRPGDWTVNYGLIKAHVINILMYDTEFTQKGVFPFQSTIWAKITNCPTCTHEVTDDQVSWSLSPPDLSFDLSNNTYSSLTEIELNQLESIIKEYRDTIGFNHLRKSYLNPENFTEISRLVIAHYLVHSHEKSISQEIDPFCDTGLSPDQLISLHMIPTLEAVTLTDLKNLPTHILLNELLIFFIDWIFTYHIKLIPNNNLNSILNLNPDVLPFKILSESMLEAGYWPILFHELNRKYKLQGYPSISTRNSREIQLYIIRNLIHTMETALEQKISSDFDIDVIAIPSHTTGESLLIATNMGLSRSRNNHLFSWLTTPSGRKVSYAIKIKDYNRIKVELNALSMISFTVIHDFKIDEEVLKPFSYSTKRDDPTLFLLLENLLGITPGVLSVTLLRLLTDVEYEPINNKIVSYFIEKKVRVMLIPISQASSIVREKGNPEFFDYYKQNAYSRKLSNACYFTPYQIIQGVQLEINLHSRSMNLSIQSVRIIEILKRLFIISRVILPRFYLRAYGSGSGKGTEWSILLHGLIHLSPSSGFSVVALNDLDGTFSAGLGVLWKNAHIYPICYDPKTPLLVPELRECSDCILNSYGNFDHTLMDAYNSNFYNSSFISSLKALLSKNPNPLKVIYIRINLDMYKYITLKELFEILLELLNIQPLSESSLICEVQFDDDKIHNVFEFLQIAKYFRKVQLLQFLGYIENPNVLIFYFHEYVGNNKESQVGLTEDAINQLQEFVDAQILCGENVDSWLTKFDLSMRNIMKVLVKLPRSNLLRFNKSFPLLTSGIERILIIPDTDEKLRLLRRHIERKITEVRPLIIDGINQETRLGSSISHNMRISCELNYFIRLLDEVTSNTDPSTYLRTAHDWTTNCQAGIDKHISDWEFHASKDNCLKWLGEEWRNQDYPRYMKLLCEFLSLVLFTQ